MPSPEPGHRPEGVAGFIPAKPTRRRNAGLVKKGAHGGNMVSPVLLELFPGAHESRRDYAERGEQADPDADSAAARRDEVLRNRDQPDQDEDRAERAQGEHDEALRDGRGQLDPRLSQQEEAEDREPDEEDE